MARQVKQGGVKPTAKAYTGRSNLGNGEVCNLDPEHGNMYNMPSGRDWCPHSDHTAGKKTYNNNDEKTISTEETLQ